MNYTKKIKSLRSINDHELDEKFEKAHNTAIANINCLTCANCCKTKSPTFTKKDINRIAKHLKISPTTFTNNYLTLNENNHYTLQQTPCIFLKENNTCAIYEIRPKACASYPHTNTRKIKNHLPYLAEHITTCPIIQHIINEL